MQRLIVLAILAALGWYAYGHYQGLVKPQRLLEAPLRSATVPPLTSAGAEGAGASNFRCDGRTYCSQMTSCAEATYFLKNCPGTKMDGNHDGVPCESQWCR